MKVLVAKLFVRLIAIVVVSTLVADPITATPWSSSTTASVPLLPLEPFAQQALSPSARQFTHQPALDPEHLAARQMASTAGVRRQIQPLSVIEIAGYSIHEIGGMERWLQDLRNALLAHAPTFFRLQFVYGIWENQRKSVPANSRDQAAEHHFDAPAQRRFMLHYPATFIKFIRVLNHVIRQEQALGYSVVLHLHTPFFLPALAAMRLLGYRYGIPVLFTSHQITIGLHRSRLTRLIAETIVPFLSRGAVLTSVSRAAAQGFPMVSALTASHVDTDFFQPAKGDGTAFRRRHARQGISADAELLLAPSRVLPDKGQEDLLVLALSLKWQSRPAQIVIMGPIQDEAFVARMRRQMADSGLGPYIVFIPAGSREEVRDAYAASAMVVHPTRQEALGNIFLEAGAMERPAVSYHVDGIPEVVENGETGLLVPANDAEALADQVLQLLDQPELRRAMGQRARQRISERYALHVHVHDWLNLYRGLVKGENPERQVNPSESTPLSSSHWGGPGYPGYHGDNTLQDPEKINERLEQAMNRPINARTPLFSIHLGYEARHYQSERAYRMARFNQAYSLLSSRWKALRASAPDLVSDRQFASLENTSREFLQNALDAVFDRFERGESQDGRVRLVLRKEGSWGQLSAEDNGQGIPERTLSRIFEYQTTSKRFSLTALGGGIGSHGGRALYDYIKIQLSAFHLFAVGIDTQELGSAVHFRKKFFSEGVPITTRGARRPSGTRIDVVFPLALKGSGSASTLRRLMPVPILGKNGKLQPLGEVAASFTLQRGRGKSRWRPMDIVGLQQVAAEALAQGLYHGLRIHLPLTTPIRDIVRRYPRIQVEIRPNHFDEEVLFDQDIKGEPGPVILRYDTSLFDPQVPEGKIRLKVAAMEAAAWLVHGPKARQEWITARTWVAALGKMSLKSFLAAYGDLSLGAGVFGSRATVKTTLRQAFHHMGWFKNEHRDVLVHHPVGFTTLMEKWAGHLVTEIDRRWPGARFRERQAHSSIEIKNEHSNRGEVLLGLMLAMGGAVSSPLVVFSGAKPVVIAAGFLASALLIYSLARSSRNHLLQTAV
jgi:glycosyltransferase involved in cell wall biosynthesis